LRVQRGKQLLLQEVEEEIAPFVQRASADGQAGRREVVEPAREVVRALDGDDHGFRDLPLADEDVAHRDDRLKQELAVEQDRRRIPPRGGALRERRREVDEDPAALAEDRRVDPERLAAAADSVADDARGLGDEARWRGGCAPGRACGESDGEKQRRHYPRLTDS